jgi:hypothetical protein
MNFIVHHLDLGVRRDPLPPLPDVGIEYAPVGFVAEQKEAKSISATPQGTGNFAKPLK